MMSKCLSIQVIAVEVIPLLLSSVETLSSSAKSDELGERIDDDAAVDEAENDDLATVDTYCPPNEITLTNFSVQHYLLRRQNGYPDEENNDKDSPRRRQRRQHKQRWYIMWGGEVDGGDAKSKTESQSEIVSGYLHSLQYANDQQKELQNRHRQETPIIWIPSDDPLQIKPVPCIVKAYVHRHHFNLLLLRNHTSTAADNEMTSAILPAAITPSTLVRIMAPRPQATSAPSPLIPSWDGKVDFLKNNLLGEESSTTPNQHYGDDENNNHNEDIIRCYDTHVVDELTLKLWRIASRTIKVGTTHDALLNYRRQVEQLNRLRRCLANSSSSTGIGRTKSPDKYEQSLPSSSSQSSTSWWWPPSIIVHSQNNCDGKTVLVQSILKERLGCDRIHVVRAGPILAKYGSRADAALECLIHTAVVSAACQSNSRHDGHGSEPPLCAIILDQLELFLPSGLSGKKSSAGGDPSVAVVNAIASYLRTISSTMQRHSEFPFPVKNSLYNNNSLTTVGQVLSVRICLVGIVTCPDDGWKAASRSQSQTGSAGTGSLDGGGSIFNSMGVGGDIFRLPLLTDHGRLTALQSFFASRGLRLADENAVARLETYSESCQWVKAGMFQKITSYLTTSVDKKGAGNVVIEDKDLDAAFESVRRVHLGVSGDGRSNTSLAAAAEAKGATAKHQQSDPSSKSSFFTSVGGAIQAKAALEDALALDEKKRTLLQQFGLHPPAGVLLYGPPGTGKTLLAKAVAEMMGESFKNVEGSRLVRGGKFISLNISDVVSSEVGTSEKTIVTAFEYADQNAPAVVFLDEFQALFTDRSSGGSGRLTTTLLQCLDDIHRWQEADDAARKVQEQHNEIAQHHCSPRVTVIAATNTPWMIDTAFLRSGRFDRVVQVGLPTLSERESIFMVHARRMRLKYDTDDDYELLKVDDDEDSPMGLRLLAHSVATQTKGYSGADIAALCRAAAVRALMEDGADAHVTRDHFSMALKYDVRPSSDDALVRQLASWRPGRY